MNVILIAVIILGVVGLVSAVMLYAASKKFAVVEDERIGKVAEGLPELCFSTLRTTGQLICIKRGETGYYPSDWDTGDKEGNVELADELNEDLGVTPIQRQAMEIGSMAGWDVPGADPKHYEESYSGQTSCANFEQKQ